jgi:hypothetical protein
MLSSLTCCCHEHDPQQHHHRLSVSATIQFHMFGLENNMHASRASSNRHYTAGFMAVSTAVVVSTTKSLILISLSFLLSCTTATNDVGRSD